MVFFYKAFFWHVCHKPMTKKGNDNDGKYIGYVAAHPIFSFHPRPALASSINFFQPQPRLTHREDHKDQRAQRQQKYC